MVETTAGTELAISAGPPATFNVAGYEALVWSVVGEVTDLGEFGREYALVTHKPLATRATQKFKGSFNEGAMNLALGLDNDDAGQVLMKTAHNSDADYSFRVTMQGGDIYYFPAKVMAWKVGVGSVDNIVGATTTLELTTNDAGVGIVEDIAP